MKIIFVRHGQTDWNKEGKIQGHADIPLNQAGISQAKELAERLKGESIDVIYCSPLTRTRQMADIINDNFHVPVITAPELIERDFGEYEGKGYHDFDFPAFWDYNHPGSYDRAEGTREFFNRVFLFLDELRKRGGACLLVSHGGVSVPVRCYGSDLREITNFAGLILHNGEILAKDI